MDVKKIEDDLFKINGRIQYLQRIASITKTGTATWEVKHVNVDKPFRVEGGKKAGGSPFDWWIDSTDWKKPIYCRSFLEAVKMLDGM